MRSLSRFARLARLARRAPLAVALRFFAVAVTLVVVVGPFLAVRYPPMTDLPFHAVHTAMFRHAADPSYHFAEQVELQPLLVPYTSMYALGALLMLVLPVAWAVKGACIVMLGLLPVGLAVLLRAMKKSPLLALAGLPFVWGNLTHWGFLSFVGAYGLFALCLGLTLRLVERPTAGKQLGLAAALLALFFTHCFRFPFAALGVAVAAVVMAPATRRVRPVVLPLAFVLVIFSAWYAVRPESLRGGLGPMRFDPARVTEVFKGLFGGCADQTRFPQVNVALVLLAGVLAMNATALLLERRFARAGRQARRFRAGAFLAVLGAAGGSVLLFFTLPMQIGSWWYVYPREASVAAFLGLALAPDLPRAAALRTGATLALGGAGLLVGTLVIHTYAQFDEATRDFQAIVGELPKAPKLAYLVFDHKGSVCSNAPFLHLPAWAQAEHGGWLSFSFLKWGAAPIRYRSREDPRTVLPPPTPRLWEWRPDAFDVQTRGRFFDWFLVRSVASPAGVFSPDPDIVPVSHVGTWWLYRRDGAVDLDPPPPPDHPYDEELYP